MQFDVPPIQIVMLIDMRENYGMGDHSLFPDILLYMCHEFGVV